MIDVKTFYCLLLYCILLNKLTLIALLEDILSVSIQNFSLILMYLIILGVTSCHVIHMASY